MKKFINEIPNFPIEGINFKDMSPLIADHWPHMIGHIATHCWMQQYKPDYFVGIESRGFIFAAGLATKLDKGIIMCRKPGKLPPPFISQKYITEYSEDELQIKEGSGKVVIVDDVLATGGTLKATNELCKKAGYEVIDNIVLMDLQNVPRVEGFDIKVKSVMQYE